MIGGIMGKVAVVDLERGEIGIQSLPDSLWLDYIGGYGIGSRLLWDWQPGKVDALGPRNTLGLVTGPLTGSPVPTGTRYTVVGKSPLTHTWGDANASGFFGPKMKHAGFDAVFFRGISPKPVMLVLENGTARLEDAADLWGMDTYEGCDTLKERYGETSESALIGPGGEKLSLIAGVVGAKGRIAARSGLGAVMGSKRVKAVVAIGDQSVPLADPAACRELKKKYSQQITKQGVGFADFYRSTGTPGAIMESAHSGDSPVRNWGGVGVIDFPHPEKIGFDALVDIGNKKRKSCWRCPVSCWGEVTGEWHGEALQVHIPEYETAAAFGSNLLMDDIMALMKSTDICNRYGLDSISTGSAVAFAIECYENGLLTKEDTGGLELAWGDAESIVALTEKLARREPGIGDLLADGTRVAALKIGKGAMQYAMQIGGQEIAMHDQRFEPAMGVIYKADATPGRHTQATQYLPAEGWDLGVPQFAKEPEKQKGRGRFVRPLASITHTYNASGLCLFGYLSMRIEAVQEWLTAVTGETYDFQRVLDCGERIANMRQAFNVREGYNLVTDAIPERAFGIPPLKEGPRAGLTVEIDMLLREHLEEMDWSFDAAVPSRRKLESLGLADVADALHNGNGHH